MVGEQITRAIDDFSRVLSFLKKNGGEKGEPAKALRARMRSGPSYLLDWGLAPTLAFLFSKAECENLDIIINALFNNKPLKKDMKPINMAYSLYLALLLKEIERLGTPLEGSNICDRAISAIRHSSVELEKKLISYMIHLKRLAEATLEKETK